MPWRSFGTGRNGVTPVEKVDQTTRWNDFYFSQAIGAPTTLTANAVIDNRLINVTSVANFSVGDWVGVFSGDAEKKSWWSQIVNINALELEMSTLAPYEFLAGKNVISTTRNMAVDGSVTPQIFEIQAGSDLEIDITRILMAMLTASAVSLSEFADIPALIYPLYLRAKENGWYDNKFTFNDNFHFALAGYDWTPYTAINPSHGQDGSKWRFSLNGDDKHGAVQRIIGDVNTLQWVVQQDLTAIELIESVGAIHEVD